MLVALPPRCRQPYRRLENVRLLIVTGVNVNGATTDGLTALMLSAFEGLL